MIFVVSKFSPNLGSSMSSSLITITLSLLSTSLGTDRATLGQPHRPSKDLGHTSKKGPHHIKPGSQ